MAILNYGQKPAASGTAKQLVVFLHGYGADGADLLGLADPLSEHMPDTMFVAPDAPNRCKVNPMGYEWFPIPRMDGSSEEDSRAGFAVAVHKLNQFLDEIAQETGIEPENTALIGFSQGTMMSLHIAPRRAEPFAGVVGFSGRLLEPEKLADEVTAKMPILLVHGDMDDMVPPDSLPHGANALTAAGFEVYTHVSKGTGHGIAQDGLSKAFGFLHRFLLKQG